MAHNADMYLSLDNNASKRWGAARVFQIGAALVGGAGLGVLATSVFSPKLASTNVATSADLYAMSAVSRKVASLPGNPAWKELAVAAIDAGSRCEVGGKPTPRFMAAVDNMKPRDVAMLATVRGKSVKGSVRGSPKQSSGELAGAFPPLDFWDPAGLSTDVSEGRLAYFREAELKHGRVCMLASLGILVAERYHPIFGGEIDVPAVGALKAVELTYFWPAVLALAGGVEIIQGFARIENSKEEGRILRDGLIPGDIGYDPLGLKDTFTEEDNIEGKELAHARLAMISTLGIVLQEVVFPEIKTLGVGSFS